MSCSYEYYKENEEKESYFPRLYCSIDDKICFYSKKCLKVNKFIPLDNQEECYKMIEEKIKNIPKNSYYVETKRPNKNGFLYLYVVIGDKVEKILTNLKELNQEYVYLKKTTSGYVISTKEFPIEKTIEKKNYNKKNNKTEKNEKQ